jgi:Ca2+-binding EF-hand superfamily protein
MFGAQRVGLAGLAIGALLATGAGIGTAPARAGNINGSNVAGPAQKEKNLTVGEKEAKKLLLLMDKDKNGKVSKQEFMNFMDAEFDRLDKDKSGELDVNELTQSPVRSSGAIHR